MFLFLPYRAKNPPENFPYCTLALILINMLVYALTSQDFLVLKERYLDQFAVSHNNLSLWRLLTAMFLHANIEHIAGNMLFLWIFGAAVEGRLRPLKFLAVYFIAGFVGGLLEDAVVGVSNPDMPCLGASGAIMGICAAYLWMFPFSTICAFWMFFFRFGTFEVQARYVVILFIGLDFINGVLLPHSDGVGHFAHLGGFGAALLAVYFMRAQRDTEELSYAKAVRADAVDYQFMSEYELEVLMQHPTDDMRLVIIYCEKLLLHSGHRSEETCFHTVRHYASPLINSGDPVRLASILLRLDLHLLNQLPTVLFLRLGSNLERMAAYDMSTRIYRRILEVNSHSSDAEVALYRLGRLMQYTYRDYTQACGYYQETLRLFPQGVMAMEAQRALADLASSTPLPGSRH